MDDGEAWSYFTYVAKNPEIYRLDAALNALGDEGWELTTSMTTVKTWLNVSGNDLLLFFKKPGAGHTVSAETIKKITGVDTEAAY